MKNLIYLILLFAVLTDKAQTIKTYLGSDFMESSKRDARYIQEESELNDTIIKTVRTIKGKKLTSIEKYHKSTPDHKYRKEYYDYGAPLKEGHLYIRNKTGIWNYYSDWGLVVISKTYVDGIEDGLSKRYYVDGNIKSEKMLRNGKGYGLHKEYYQSGGLRSEGTMFNSLKDGVFREYNEKGDLLSRSFYVSDKREGNDSVYRDGKLYNVTGYKNNQKHGPFYFFKNGELIHTGSYIEDALSKSEVTLDSAQMVEFGYILDESMPEFIGGERALGKFLMNFLEYPEIAKEEGKEGTVFIKFTIDKTGNAKDIDILSDPVGYGLDKAAYEVITKMPAWIPGKQNGVPVPVFFNIPIKFRLM